MKLLIYIDTSVSCKTVTLVSKHKHYGKEKYKIAVNLKRYNNIVYHNAQISIKQFLNDLTFDNIG